MKYLHKYTETNSPEVHLFSIYLLSTERISEATDGHALHLHSSVQL